MESQLSALRSAPWPATALGCSRAEVEEYADVVEAVEEVSGQLQVGVCIKGVKDGHVEGGQQRGRPRA